MKQGIIWVFVWTIFSFTLQTDDAKEAILQQNFQRAEDQYHSMLQAIGSQQKLPRSVNDEGTLKLTDIDDWTTGFWPGSLWLLYEYTKEPRWKNAAEKYTHYLEANQFNTEHHDIGFMMYCSYGNGLRLTKNPSYQKILVQSAQSLCKRFNEKVGCIKSWNDKPSWDGTTIMHYPVIIDNMMNLELLFFASKVTGDPIFKNIAIRHATTTMKYHLRKDYSSYHVVDYDTATGKVLHQETNQGYAHASTWARGQAWGIYGFTMTYRETRQASFLQTAQRMADYYIFNPNLPEDKIAPWDFNALQKGFVAPPLSKASHITSIKRDVSAAAVTASALMELSTYPGKNRKKYYETGVAILKALSSKNYLADKGNNHNFLLMHSVGSIPHGFEVDQPLIYADYYFLEGLMRWKAYRTN